MNDLLLINLGTGNYERTTYRFPCGFEQSTAIAGLAMWRWLDSGGRSPSSVRFACTEKAWQAKEDQITKAIDDMGLERAVLGKPILLELPRTIEDVWSVLPPLQAWVSEYRGEEGAPKLHMDLTHGYRAIPIAHTWLGLYLKRLGLAETGVMGYGAFERDQKVTPFIDLSHLTRVADWAAAAYDLELHGDALDLSELLKTEEASRRIECCREGNLLPDEANAFKVLRRVANAAESIGKYFPAGLPVELGIETARLLEGIKEDDVRRASEAVFPSVAESAVKVYSVARKVAWVDEIGSRTQKGGLRLSVEELDRQLVLVGMWRRRRAIGEALRGFRELMVNRVLFSWDPAGLDWLRENNRKKAESALRELRPAVAGYPGPPLGTSEDLVKIGKLWDQVSVRRNPFAHAGMKQDTIDVDKADRSLGEYVETYEYLVSVEGLWNLPPNDPRNEDPNA